MSWLLRWVEESVSEIGSSYIYSYIYMFLPRALMFTYFSFSLFNRNGWGESVLWGVDVEFLHFVFGLGFDHADRVRRLYNGYKALSYSKDHSVIIPGSQPEDFSLVQHWWCPRDHSDSVSLFALSPMASTLHHARDGTGSLKTKDKVLSIIVSHNKLDTAIASIQCSCQLQDNGPFITSAPGPIIRRTIQQLLLNNPHDMPS